MFKDTERCRGCGSLKMLNMFSLGIQNVKDFLDSPQADSKQGPLDLVLCQECGLLQLKHTFSKEFLYTHYWYRSSTSITMINELANIVHKAEQLVDLNENDIVVDIGSNDGTLLKQYINPNLIKVGFEPSNLWKYGLSDNTIIINDYFNEQLFTKRFPGKKAKIISSIAMFYDLDDPNSFTQGIKNILAKDGVWIIQMNYLGLMLKNLGYDNICHEHVAYYSLNSLKRLLERHNLNIFDVELNNVNGGSFRIYVKHINDQTKIVNSKIIKEIQKKELKLELSNPNTYLTFYGKVIMQRKKLQNLIYNLLNNGKKIFIYGASTRGLVVLEFCGIDEPIVQFATDKNPDKWGKYLSGTKIKVISLENYRKLKPDYLLVLPYQYINEIAYQEREFLYGGGKLIVPLPEPTILDKEYLKSIEEKKKEEFMEGYDQL